MNICISIAISISLSIYDPISQQSIDFLRLIGFIFSK